jgi:hypothetical protein
MPDVGQAVNLDKLPPPYQYIKPAELKSSGRLFLSLCFLPIRAASRQTLSILH